MVHICGGGNILVASYVRVGVLCVVVIRLSLRARQERDEEGNQQFTAGITVRKVNELGRVEGCKSTNFQLCAHRWTEVDNGLSGTQ